MKDSQILWHIGHALAYAPAPRLDMPSLPGPGLLVIAGAPGTTRTGPRLAGSRQKAGSPPRPYLCPRAFPSIK